MQDIWETRVRFEETDAQAVVFYGNYVTYQDETVSQYLRDIDYGWGQQSTFDIHVVNVDVNYRKSATFGDELVCAARIEQIGDASLTFEWECRRKADDAVCADGTVTHVCVRDGRADALPRRAARGGRRIPGDTAVAGVGSGGAKATATNPRYDPHRRRRRRDTGIGTRGRRTPRHAL